MKRKSYIAALVGLSICLPAAATDQKVSRRDIKALIAQEVGKVKGKTGPKGDRGAPVFVGRVGRVVISEEPRGQWVRRVLPAPMDHRRSYSLMSSQMGPSTRKRR